MNKPRKCPECGIEFSPASYQQAFCSPPHQKRFHKLMANRGQVVLPLLLVMRAGKRGRTDDTAYALQQVSALADKWRAEDKAAGRDAGIVVTGKRVSGWQAADLK